MASGWVARDKLVAAGRQRVAGSRLALVVDAAQVVERDGGVAEEAAVDDEGPRADDLLRVRVRLRLRLRARGRVGVRVRVRVRARARAIGLG